MLIVDFCLLIIILIMVNNVFNLFNQINSALKVAIYHKII